MTLYSSSGLTGAAGLLADMSASLPMGVRSEGRKWAERPFEARVATSAFASHVEFVFRLLRDPTSSQTITDAAKGHGKVLGVQGTFSKGSMRNILTSS